MTLRDRLQLVADDAGMDFIDACDLEPAGRFLAEHGCDVSGYGRGISMGIRVPETLFTGVADRHPGLVLAYRYHCQVAGSMLDVAANRIARLLNDEGYKALPVPSGQRLARDELMGLASHKVAAHLSGQGVIGLSGLFLQSKFGPGVRLVTVFTDADLPVGDYNGGSCLECGLCVSKCPAGAIAGRRFDPAEGRDLRVDVHKCDEYSDELKRKWRVDIPGTVCGLCVAVCPQVNS